MKITKKIISIIVKYSQDDYMRFHLTKKKLIDLIYKDINRE